MVEIRSFLGSFLAARMIQECKRLSGVPWLKRRHTANTLTAIAYWHLFIISAPCGLECVEGGASSP